MTLKVIGAGLGRTGTMSLKLGLERLGFGPCYHMSELIMNQSRIPLWIAAADGKPDWETIFAGYAATVDYPGCSHWRELARAYPDAKIVLTERDPVQWFESTQATIFSELMSAKLRESPLAPFFEKNVWKDFGDRIHDRDFMIGAFEKHCAGVRREIPKNRLLVYEVAQGWEPLCAFLGVAAPAEPFPKVNSREEMAALIAASDVGNAAELTERAKGLLQSSKTGKR